jgi:3-oxoacyl-[acyl-carrier protein] reductase
MELDGKIALVTGGSRGIGAAICRELGEAGAHVIIGYRSNREQAEMVAADLPRVSLAQGDVSTAAGCASLLEGAADVGNLDILVNNAGIKDDGLAVRMSDASWQQVMETNAGGCFRMSRSALQVMMKNRSGIIVNIASVSGLRGNAGQANYAASKAAIISLTQTLAKEMGRRGIRINAVAPGFITTDMTDTLPPEAKQTLLKNIPLQRLGSARDVAHTVRFLCGPGAEYITGECLVVDGGLSL